MDTTFTQEKGQQTSSRRPSSATRNPLFTDRLIEKVDGLDVDSASDVARTIALYIKILGGNEGVINCVSTAYIDLYDGKRFYARFNKWFDKIHEYFSQNGFSASEKRRVLKKVAMERSSLPTKVSQMKQLSQRILLESHSWLNMRRKIEVRKSLLDKFKSGIKKYLHLAYELGYNEPSLCAMTLAKTHKIDKYILSGDFPLILLPFLPDLEESIQLNYQNYAMKDSWEMIRERYFNQRDKYMTLAVEIKSVFARNIRNFSDYFDKMYSDTYYKLMLSKKR